MSVCRNIAADVAQGRLSREELDELLDDLTREKRRLEAGDGLENVEAGLMQRGRVIAEESQLAAMIETRNRLQNILVEDRLMQMARRLDGAQNRPDLGIQAALVGINTPVEGAQRSVDSLTQGLMNSYMGGFVADLRRANLLTQFNKMKGDFERQVARALSDLNLPEPTGKVEASAEAKQIAQLMHKYQRAAMERENRAGAYIRNKSGYVVRQSHDPGKLARAGLNRWKDAVRDKLDYELMEIAPDRIEDFLDSAYTAIKSGIRLTQQINDLDKAFTGPGNLAKKQSASRVLEFKSADDWYDYDQEFGRGSLRESFQQDLSRAAQSTALMTNFGTNPEAMLDRVIRKLQQEYRTDEKKLKQLTGGMENLKAQLKEVDGSINFGAGDTVARAFAGFRALQTMAKLGGAWVSALSDIAFMASNRMYQGRSLLDSWGDAFSAPMQGMSRGQRREYADLLGAGLEGQLGDFMGRFNAADTVAGRTSKLQALFFKLNLLGPWTDASKRGVTLMISRDLAMKAGKTFDQLDASGQRLLRMYGIGPEQWEVARLAVKPGPEGRTYLMPGDVDGLDFPQKVKDEVRDSLFALMSQEADYAVPSPGARERAIMRRGYEAGTSAGEAMRFIGQFKSFGVTAMTKVMGRQVYGQEGTRKLSDIMSRGMGQNLGLVNTIAGATLLGYFVMQAKEVMKGRDPRPNDSKALIAAMLQGGGLGIYGDFIFGEANRFGGGTLDTLAGPGIGTFAEAIDVLQKFRGAAVEGEDMAWGDMLRLVKSNIPFANLFYTKQALDYMLWYHLQEMINPGYLRRMERRIERENNQRFYAPPSATIATGGGFR